MNDFLTKIIEIKKEEVATLYQTIGLKKLEQDCPAIFPYSPHAFHKALSIKGLSLIAEIKKASPSKGVIRQEFDPLILAKEFEANGARALSILTETEYFKGSPTYISEIRKITALPILRKDFIIDPIQIFESKKLGADAILLIKAILSEAQLRDFQILAHRIGLDVLVEVHTPEELDQIQPFGCPIIGINNRDLKEFSVNTATALKLAKKIPLTTPKTLIVAESGYTHIDELKTLQNAHFDGILIGEGLATHSNLLKDLGQLS